MLAGLLTAWASEWTVMKRIIIIMLDFLVSSLQTSRWCWLVCSPLENLGESFFTRIIIIMLDILASSLQTSQWCWLVCSPLENLDESYYENNHYYLNFLASSLQISQWCWLVCSQLEHLDEQLFQMTGVNSAFLSTFFYCYPWPFTGVFNFSSYMTHKHNPKLCLFFFFLRLQTPKNVVQLSGEIKNLCIFVIYLYLQY